MSGPAATIHFRGACNACAARSRRGSLNSPANAEASPQHDDKSSACVISGRAGTYRAQQGPAELLVTLPGQVIRQLRFKLAMLGLLPPRKMPRAGYSAGRQSQSQGQGGPFSGSGLENVLSHQQSGGPRYLRCRAPTGSKRRRPIGGRETSRRNLGWACWGSKGPGLCSGVQVLAESYAPHTQVGRSFTHFIQRCPLSNHISNPLEPRHTPNPDNVAA
jgi:hypothetical protein